MSSIAIKLVSISHLIDQSLWTLGRMKASRDNSRHTGQEIQRRDHWYHLSRASTEINFNTPSGPLYVTVWGLSLYCTLSVSLWNTTTYILWDCNRVKVQSFTFLARPFILDHWGLLQAERGSHLIWVLLKNNKDMPDPDGVKRASTVPYYITAYCESAIYIFKLILLYSIQFFFCLFLSISIPFPLLKWLL